MDIRPAQQDHHKWRRASTASGDTETGTWLDGMSTGARQTVEEDRHHWGTHQWHWKKKNYQGEGGQTRLPMMVLVKGSVLLLTKHPVEITIGKEVSQCRVFASWYAVLVQWSDTCSMVCSIRLQAADSGDVQWCVLKQDTWLEAGGCDGAWASSPVTTCVTSHRLRVSRHQMSPSES